MKKHIFTTFMAMLLSFSFNFSINAVYSGNKGGICVKRKEPETKRKKRARSKKRRKDEKQVREENYSINLMWVNDSFNESQLYIYPSQDEEDLRKNFLNHIFKWATVSRGSTVNVWFDSALTSDEAVENTWRLIEEYANKYPEMALIRLRDVRQLPEVIQHPEVFSDNIPVYFRVDLLRAIIALYMLFNHEIFYFVYADLDMEPLSQEQIFDDETMQKLQKYGIVMAKCDYKPFENGFQIISYHNYRLIRAMRWALIDVNIQRAYKVLKFLSGAKDKTLAARELSNMKFEQVVFNSYTNMFRYFYFLEGYGTIKVGDEIYNKRKHGFAPFIYQYFDVAQLNFVFENDQISYSFPSCPDMKFIKVPTKQVDLPMSRFG